MLTYIGRFLSLEARHVLAIASGHREMRQQCVAEYEGTQPDVASARGLVPLLEFLHSTGRLRKMGWSERALDHASYEGHLHVLQWWLASGLELKWSVNAMNWASYRGHLSILDFFLAAPMECRYSHLAVDLAAAGGHLPVLRWWKRHFPRLKGTRNAYVLARRHQHAHVVRMLRHKRMVHPWGNPRVLCF